MHCAFLCSFDRFFQRARVLVPYWFCWFFNTKTSLQNLFLRNAQEHLAFIYDRFKGGQILNSFDVKRWFYYLPIHSVPTRQGAFKRCFGEPTWTQSVCSQGPPSKSSLKFASSSYQRGSVPQFVVLTPNFTCRGWHWVKYPVWPKASNWWHSLKPAERLLSLGLK